MAHVTLPLSPCRISASLLVVLITVAYSQVPTEWSFNSGSQQVWHNDYLWYENYIGKRSIEYNANFTYDSQYRICSNTKLFTSVSIMQLVERGLIKSIHDNIADYLSVHDLRAWGLFSIDMFG